jgi:membrane protease YdiL (CAAX protease family)
MATSQQLRFAQRHPIAAYYVLALAISWLIEAPLIASAQGWWNLQIPFSLHYLASFGPMLAALFLTWATTRTEGLKELWSRITRWRVGAFGFAFAVFSPVALFALAALVVRLANGDWPNFALLGQINYMPYLGVWALVLWLLTFGFGEEIGWRGFALPRLQNGRSALAASFILWGMWTVWHIPSFFYLETYMKLGISMLPVFALGVLAGTIVLTWLYNTTNGSILMLALWHGLFDFLSASKVSDGTIAAVMSTVVVVWAVVVVIVYKPANLSRFAKQIL